MEGGVASDTITIIIFRFKRLFAYPFLLNYFKSILNFKVINEVNEMN